MAIPFTYQMLIQRIKKHMNNGLANDAYSVSDNEILLYIEQAIAFNLVGKVWDMARVTGVMEVPEAYLVTLQLPPVQRDNVSGYWFSTLPQPPVGLPLGYSINRVYPAMSAFGQGEDFLPIKAKRVGYRKLLPFPPGGRYWVEGQTIWLTSNNNSSLLAIPFYVQLPVTRTTDITQPMNLPDDAIQTIFDTVVAELTRRYQNPKDIINDDLPAGRNNVNTPGV